MEPLVQIRIRSDDDLRCHSSKDAVSLINEEEKGTTTLGVFVLWFSSYNELFFKKNVDTSTRSDRM